MPTPAATLSLPVSFDAGHGETDELAHPDAAMGERLDDGDLACRQGRAHVDGGGAAAAASSRSTSSGRNASTSPDDDRLTVSSGSSHGLVGRWWRRTSQPQNPRHRRQRSLPAQRGQVRAEQVERSQQHVDVAELRHDVLPAAQRVRRKRRYSSACFLHVPQRHARVEGSGDEGMAQCVRADPLRDAGATGDATHDSPGCVPVQSAFICLDEDRTVEPFPHGQVDGASDPRRERHRGGLAALAAHGQGAMATLQAESGDVGADRFGDAQPVQCQQ